MGGLIRLPISAGGGGTGSGAGGATMPVSRPEARPSGTPAIVPAVEKRFRSKVTPDSGATPDGASTGAASELAFGALRPARLAARGGGGGGTDGAGGGDRNARTDGGTGTGSVATSGIRISAATSVVCSARDSGTVYHRAAWRGGHTSDWNMFLGMFHP